MGSHDSNDRAVRGLLLGRVAYGEADLIVHLFTEPMGKVAALARGARRSQKRFGGSLEALHTLTLHLGGRPQGELFTLKEAALETTRLGLTSDLDSLETAGKALAWVKQSAPPLTPEPRVWSALLALLDELERPEHIEPRSLLVAFGVQLLDGLGWGLDLERCVSCGKPCPEGQAAWVHPERGGLICRSCGGGPLLLPGQLRTQLRDLGASGPYTHLAEHGALGLKVVERAIGAHVGG
jgi:DNA repair protein RecO (recombination protein O)